MALSESLLEFNTRSKPLGHHGRFGGHIISLIFFHSIEKGLQLNYLENFALNARKVTFPTWLEYVTWSINYTLVSY